MWDYGLAEAANRLANERCKKCGVEAWHAHSEDANILFKLEEHKCHACAHLEEVEDKKSDKEKKKHGVTEQVVAIHALDEALPSRSDWIEEVIKDYNKKHRK